tara:strand:+ start:1480 stop:1788 length:309 start_codon:yes stop_codon:yes gene_type:complete
MMNREEYDRIQNCDHMGADWIEWGNLVWGDGRGQCPDCNAILDDIQIKTGAICNDEGEDLEDFDTDLFCHTCDEYDEEGCGECHTCTNCVNLKARHQCGGCP